MTLAQAARELEIPEHDLRSLCRTGVIRSRVAGRGSGYQISAREVARFKRDRDRRRHDEEKRASPGPIVTPGSEEG